MKKLKGLIFSILFFLITTSCFTGCTSGDKYKLFSVSGLGLSASHYDYNYITFNFKKNTYILKNKAKANGIVSKQTGNFSFEDETTITITNNEIPLQNYFLYSTETLEFSEDFETFYVTAYISGTRVTMTYKK